jgi:hypothetical protein
VFLAHVRVAKLTQDLALSEVLGSTHGEMRCSMSNQVFFALMGISTIVIIELLKGYL